MFAPPKLNGANQGSQTALPWLWTKPELKKWKGTNDSLSPRVKKNRVLLNDMHQYFRSNNFKYFIKLYLDSIWSEKCEPLYTSLTQRQRILLLFKSVYIHILILLCTKKIHLYTCIVYTLIMLNFILFLKCTFFIHPPKKMLRMSWNTYTFQNIFEKKKLYFSFIWIQF